MPSNTPTPERPVSDEQAEKMAAILPLIPFPSKSGLAASAMRTLADLLADRDWCNAEMARLTERHAANIKARDEARREADEANQRADAAEKRLKELNYRLRVPDGAVRADAWIYKGQLIVCGEPPDDRHDCDLMGCTSVSHVLIREPLAPDGVTLDLSARLAAAEQEREGMREALVRIDTGDRGDWNCSCPAPEIARAALAAGQEQGGQRSPLACMDCGKLYRDFPLDVSLTDDQWALIHNSPGGVLCANCIVARVKQMVPGVTVVNMSFSPDPPPQAAGHEQPQAQPAEKGGQQG